MAGGAPKPQPKRKSRRDFVGTALLRVIGRRLFNGLVMIFVVTAVSFVLVSLIPGDPARSILGIDATEDQIEALRQQLGLDLPLYQQYWEWVQGAVRGDFGRSVWSGQPVTEILEPRVPVTLWLVVGTMLVSLVVGVTFGVIGAVRKSIIGRAIDALSLFGFAMPAFWLGAILASIFAVRLGWFPSAGYVPLAESPSDWLRSLVLPVATLAAGGVALVAKHTREAMLDVLGSEYIRMARSSGLSGRSIILRHALKNASVRIFTVLGLVGIGALGGTVVIESVFALPGLGNALVDSTSRGDLPIAQAVVTYYAIVVVVLNLVVDLGYVWANPKVRVS